MRKDNISKVKAKDEVEAVIEDTIKTSNTSNSSYERGESSTKVRGRNNPRLRYDKSQLQCYNC